MIRVATSTLFEQGVFNLQERQAALVKLQDQIATGRRVRVPSDDPVSAARSLEIEQSKGINEQYIRNGNTAVASLSQSENTLTSVTLLLQDVKTLALNAGNGALSTRELHSLADDLRARYQELIGLANATDGNGQHLFSGYRGSTRPFSEAAPGVVSYAGDQGARLIQISASRQVAISDAGSHVFQMIRDGNGTFATAAAAANTGTAIVSPGTVTDSVAWNGAGNPGDFSVVFHVDTSVNPPVTTYDIVDNVNNISLTTGAAPAAGPYPRIYSDNGTISLSRQAPPDTNPVAFDFGAELSIRGQPASGDTFTVRTSTNEDVFETVHNLITALETAPPSGSTGNIALTNRLNTALTNLDNALDNVLRVRAAIGARLREVEATQTSQADLVVQYDSTLSQLRDLDYAAAITDLTRNQFTYQAAQQSFIRVQSLSLFDLL